MKIFKNKNDKIYEYEDDVPEEFLDEKIEELGLTEISEEEANAIRNPPLTQEELEAKMISDGETLVEAHIQAPVDAYNAANGVKFAHAHSCANYKDEINYIHQPFCLEAWNFNVAVWEASRLIQIDILAGTIPEPTPEEFITMLPVFGA